MKVVYNAQHGGFSLSDAAIRRYAEIKGLKLYPEQDASGLITTWWTTPKSDVPDLIDNSEWFDRSLEDRQASNAAHEEHSINDRDIPRTDPVLVQVVEEMGDAASGRHATLKIADVPTGERYRIDEYDGYESVMTVDDYDWEIAS